MLSLLLILVLVADVVAVAAEITWTPSVPLLQPLSHAAYGSNRAFTRIYLIGRIENVTSPVTDIVYSQHIYEFDGSQYTEIGKGGYNNMDYQWCTTVADIIYIYNIPNANIIGYNTTSLTFLFTRILVPQTQNNDQLDCFTSNHTHLIVLYTNSLGFNLFSVYDLTAQAWNIQPFRTSWWIQSYAGCGYYNGIGYVFGGEDASHADTAMITAFNFTSDAWTQLNVSLTANASALRSLMPNTDSGVFYILGGDPPSATVDVFDANEQTVTTTTAPMHTARYKPMLGFMNGRMYVLGGTNGSAYLSSTERSTVIPTAHPTTNPTPTPSSAPTASPSFSPTAPPTLSPSLPPTVPPTQSPTTPPTPPPPAHSQHILGLPLTAEQLAIFGGIIVVCLGIAIGGVMYYRARKMKRARNANANALVQQQNQNHNANINHNLIAPPPLAAAGPLIEGQVEGRQRLIGGGNLVEDTGH